MMKMNVEILRDKFDEASMCEREKGIQEIASIVMHAITASDCSLFGGICMRSIDGRYGFGGVV